MELIVTCTALAIAPMRTGARTYRLASELVVDRCARHGVSLKAWADP
jgi:hypothetical protein